MAGKLGKFQTIGFSHWKGLTKDNHLGSIFQMAPQKATNLMVQLLAYYRGKTLDTFLSQFPTREFEDDTEYYWDVIGSSRRNIPLVEARDENGVVVTDLYIYCVGGFGADSFYLDISNIISINFSGMVNKKIILEINNYISIFY